MCKPADEFNYVYSCNYNRYNYDNTYIPEENHDWWYVHV